MSDEELIDDARQWQLNIAAPRGVFHDIFFLMGCARKPTRDKIAHIVNTMSPQQLQEQNIVKGKVVYEPYPILLYNAVYSSKIESKITPEDYALALSMKKMNDNLSYFQLAQIIHKKDRYIIEIKLATLWASLQDRSREEATQVLWKQGIFLPDRTGDDEKYIMNRAFAFARVDNLPQLADLINQTENHDLSADGPLGMMYLKLFTLRQITNYTDREIIDYLTGGYLPWYNIEYNWQEELYRKFWRIVHTKYTKNLPSIEVSYALDVLGSDEPPLDYETFITLLEVIPSSLIKDVSESSKRIYREIVDSTDEGLLDSITSFNKDLTQEVMKYLYPLA